MDKRIKPENNVVKMIETETDVVFIIRTKYKSDFWWWAVDILDWNSYWETHNVNPNYDKATQFCNDIDNTNLGCSCASFKTVLEAMFDAELQDTFEYYIEDLHSKGLHLECGFGCEFLGYTCAGNPETNYACPYSVVVNADGEEVNQ